MMRSWSLRRSRVWGGPACTFIYKCVCTIRTGVNKRSQFITGFVTRVGKWQGCDLLHSFTFYFRLSLKPASLIKWAKVCICYTSGGGVMGVVRLICIQVNFRNQHILWLPVRKTAKHDWLCLIVGVMRDLWPTDCVFPGRCGSFEY